VNPRVLVALDSFKGTIDSAAAGEALASGIMRARPDAAVTVLTVGDGGEGTLLALREANGGAREVTTEILDQNRADSSADFLLFDNGIAYIESAAAVALPRARVAPLERTSFGIGQLVGAAVAHGARRILVGCGGTGTVDAGLGFLHALAGRPPPETGEPTARELERTLSEAARALGRVSLVAVTDVRNALRGPQGAAIFVPQKVPDPTDLRPVLDHLDAMASVYDEVAHGRGRPPVSMLAGAGAAGGLPAAMFLLGASCVSGLDLVCEATGFDDLAAAADLLVTGEGCLDQSTFDGKLTSGLLARAQSGCVIVAGSATPEGERLACLNGAQAVYTLFDALGLADALAFPEVGLRQIGASIAALLP
jgi:glycerate 2-kinase